MQSTIEGVSGGYVLALRMPPRVAERIAEVSSRIQQVIPSIAYDGTNIHTTVLVFDVQKNFSPQDGVLDQFAQCVRAVGKRNNIRVNYARWMANRNSVIVSGAAPESFFAYCRSAHGAVVHCGKKVELSWGSHATVNRFLGSGFVDEVPELLRICEKAKPIGVVSPVAIDAAYFMQTPTEFTFHTHDRLSL